jgi:hypothetical protein
VEEESESEDDELEHEIIEARALRFLCRCFEVVVCKREPLMVRRLIMLCSYDWELQLMWTRCLCVACGVQKNNCVCGDVSIPGAIF